MTVSRPSWRRSSNGSELGKTVAASFLAGVGVTAAFAVAIYGAAQFNERRRSGETVAAAGAGVIAGLGLAVCAAGDRLRPDRDAERLRRGDGPYDRSVRTARNVAIIAVLAVPVAFVPGGGNAAEAILTALLLGFLAGIALIVYTLYRQNQLTLSTLNDSRRAALYGAVGGLALLIAGQDELLDGAGGHRDLDRPRRRLRLRHLRRLARSANALAQVGRAGTGAGVPANETLCRKGS